MGGKKGKVKKSSSKSELSRKIIELFRRQPHVALNYKRISKRLGIHKPIMRKAVLDILEQMVLDERLIRIDRGKYALNYTQPEVEGIITFASTGKAFVSSEGLEEDVMVYPEHTGYAIKGDFVRVGLLPGKKSAKPKGEVLEILKRKTNEFVGVVKVKKNEVFLMPSGMKPGFDIMVPKEHVNGAKNGEKAIVEISKWPDERPVAVGKIKEVLGMPGENETEMHAIMAEFNLPFHFDPKLEREAKKLDEGISKEEIKRREDFRKVTTFTIDPDTAKDFDDALSIREVSEGIWEIGVHIADVSHYVTPESVIDKEAYERGTSVYLVDRVVPMLPEKLSNALCSLRPHEDKLCYSAIFEINEKAIVLQSRIVKTVIHSDHRFTYEEAQKIIEGEPHQLDREVKKLNEIATILREKRLKQGAIAFDKLEVGFQLNDKGEPIGIYTKHHNEAHHLIEEFMLLANRTVAEKIGKREKGNPVLPFVYRIHDNPDPEKLRIFSDFIRKFGYRIQTREPRKLTDSFNKLFKEIEHTAEENVIEQMAIRTMSKAVYSVENIGHYGLAFRHYTHFTSPIRRYPDLIVHRLLFHYLNGGKPQDENLLASQCKHTSQCERQATDAERMSIKYKQVQFMQDKVGQLFVGVISGMNEFGLYVEIEENKCEGMIRLRDFTDDYYSFVKNKQEVVGRKYGQRFQLGDRIEVRVKKADLLRRQLDFIPAD